MNGKGSKPRPTNIIKYIQNFDEIKWKNNMKIAEIFGPTIQGEGFSSGVPCVFIRFAGCNLHCGMKGLFEEGKATWKCDTEKIWTQGTEYTNEQLFQKLKDMKVLDDITKGKLRIVVTGGEPLIKSNRDSLNSFIDYLKKELQDKFYFIYWELETNGTIDNDLYDRFYQINCSPKLSNSGLSESLRINGAAIERINKHRNSWFKFVVNNESDVKEIIEKFVVPFNINLDKVIFMPDSDSVTTIAEKTRNVWELSVKYGVRMCTRLHILCFNKQAGI